MLLDVRSNSDATDGQQALLNAVCAFEILGLLSCWAGSRRLGTIVEFSTGPGESKNMLVS